MKLLCIAAVCLSVCVVFSTALPVTEQVYEKDQVIYEFGGHQNATKMAAGNKTKEYETRVTVSPHKKTTTTKMAVHPKPQVFFRTKRAARACRFCCKNGLCGICCNF